MISSNYEYLLTTRVSLGLILFIVFGTIIYRLLIHPYSKYPGPLLWRISGLPLLYHTWKGDTHICLYEFHATYGIWVRYSPNKLSINHVDALQDIYGFNKNILKPDEFFRAFRPNVHAANTFNTGSKEQHRRKRRIMAKAFSVAALESYHEIIGKKVTQFMQNLRKGSLSQGQALTPNKTGIFDMAIEWNNMMFDIMGALCLGESFGFLSGKGEKILHDAHLRAKRVYMTCHSPWFKTFKIDTLLFPHLVKANTDFFTFARKQVFSRIAKFKQMEKVKEEEGYYDILGHLLEVRDGEENDQYTDLELLSECTLMIIAGSGTSASALTATIFYLVRNPDVLEKLRNEITTAFGTYDEIVQGSPVLNLKYLRACIDEAMRLSPPAPTNLVRIAGPGGAPVLDQNIPAGYYVGVPNFSLFRNSRYFSKPNEYVPDRWMEDTAGMDAETMKVQRKAFEPFSIGPRHCIGKHLAMSEITFALARVIYSFDIRPIGRSGESPIRLSSQDDRQHMLEQWDTYTSVEPHCEVSLVSLPA